MPEAACLQQQRSQSSWVGLGDGRDGQASEQEARDRRQNHEAEARARFDPITNYAATAP